MSIENDEFALPRMPQPAIDISDDDHLICYAARSQLARLKSGQAGVAKVPNETVATMMGMAKANLATALRTRLSLMQLRKLDSAVIALAPEMARIGGLVALATRLRGWEGGEDVSAAIPPAWTGELLRRKPGGSVDSLIQASALLSAFPAGGTDEASRGIRDRYGRELQHVVERLMLIGFLPPGPLSDEALVMLGSLASRGFANVREPLDRALRESPFGFRLWRGLTSIVRASNGGRSPRRADGLTGWIQRLLRDSSKMRAHSINPAQALDLELAVAVPAGWITGGPDWADEALRARAEMSGPENAGQATFGERASAALGLWERASIGHSTANGSATKQYLRELAGRFRQEAAHPGPGASAGLRWVADTVEQVLDHDGKVCDLWLSESGEPCVQIVRDAASLISVPAAIIEATQRLFEHAVLQNAEVYRRRAIDALRTGGYVKVVCAALGRILDNPEAEPWLRCRTLSAMGYLNTADAAIDVLQKAYGHACNNLTVTQPTTDLIAEVHAAVTAVGDCFGVPGTEGAARDLRAYMDPTLEDLVSRAVEMQMAPIARASAYAVAITTQRRDRGLLETLSRHADPVTVSTAKWVLRNRFAPDGSIVPLTPEG